MFYFYVLYSLKDNRLYKGSTSNLLRRVEQHSAGATKKGPSKGRAFQSINLIYAKF
jgi:predicted GIY-YIG superfamily endonuclease